MKHHFDVADKKELAKSEILRIAIKIGKTPTQKEYKIQTDTAIKISQINYLFGSWNDAILFSGLSTNSTDPPRNDISYNDLRDEFISVSNRLGKIPGMNGFRVESKYSYRPYIRRFGNWQKAVDYYTRQYSTEFNFELKTIRVERTPKALTPKLLGLNLPLINIPTNEFETIVLFSLLASELNIKTLKNKCCFF